MWGSSMKHKRRAKKLEPRKEEKPLLPVVMALLVVGILALTIFSVNPNTSVKKTGAAALSEEKDVNCLRKGSDNSNIAVDSKDSCCFLIKNTDRCRLATGEYAYYVGRTGDFAGSFNYDYACFGGSTDRLFFTNDVKYYCGLEI